MRITCLAILTLALATQLAAAGAAAELLSPSTWFGGGKTTLSTKPKSSLLKTPPVVSKMSDGTKRLLSSPTKMFKPKPKPIKKSGTTNIIKAKRPEAEKQGFFKSMFSPEPPPPPKTIKEWMSLKQVHP